MASADPFGAWQMIDLLTAKYNGSDSFPVEDQSSTAILSLLFDSGTKKLMMLIKKQSDLIVNCS